MTHTYTAYIFKKHNADGFSLCTNGGDKLDIRDADVTEYLDYCNPDTLSMSFDGDIYDVFNYDLFPSLLEKFDKLLESYGLYYELGNSWNLSLYEN